MRKPTEGEKEVDCLSFPATAEPAIEPGEQALDFPTAQVASDWPPILHLPAIILAVRRDHRLRVHAATARHRIAVIAAIPDRQLGRHLLQLRPKASICSGESLVR